MTVVALTPARTPAHAVVVPRVTYEVSGVPLYRTPAGALIAPTGLTVRVIDGRAELDLTGLQIDPRTLDPAQPENRVGCRVPIDLAPGWVIQLVTGRPQSPADHGIARALRASRQLAWTR